MPKGEESENLKGNVSSHNGVSHPSFTASQDGKDIEAKDDPVAKRYTYTQWITLATLAFGNFCVGACVSLQAPFFPREAEAKGATPTEYGFIFGAYQLTIFITAPIVGKLLSYVPPKFLLNVGIFTVGVTCVLFGTLDLAPNGVPFVSLAFAVRIVEGAGAASLKTATYTIIAAEFEETLSTTFAVLETFLGIGLITGPTVGGALYDAGGYGLPFFVMGGLVLIDAVTIYIILPNPGGRQNNGNSMWVGHGTRPRRSTVWSFRRTVRHDIGASLPASIGLLLPSTVLVFGAKGENEKKADFIKFWLNPGIMIYSLTIFTSFNYIGFTSSTLEPHVRPFNLSGLLLGMIFALSGAVYAISAMFWGWLGDKKIGYRLLIFIGCCLAVVSLLLIGPMPFFPMEPRLDLVIAALVFMGLSLGGKLVSTFGGAMEDTIVRGFPADMTTYGLISSMFASSQSLGAFVGPSLGGYLLEAVKFRMATVVLLSLEILLMILISIYACVKKWRTTGEEKQPLIPRNLERRTSYF